MGLEIKRNSLVIGENLGKVYGAVRYPQKVDMGWLSKITNIPSTIVSVGITPVSYTHLDVYKRQPRECWRLQGFTDEMFDKARAVNSDNQLYRQAGNSVTVPVIYAIGKQILAAQKALECGE